MLEEIQKAKIVITNYRGFKLRERIELSKGGRSLLQGRGEALNTLETEGQVMQRVMPELMNLNNILVINDEAIIVIGKNLKLRNRSGRINKR